MNNKRLRMLNKELGLNDYTDVPNIQATIKNVNNNINTNFTERRLYMRKKIISSALVTVLFISITSLTVIAATLGWHYKLIEYFKNPTIKQMELMNGSFDAPIVTKSDNGYTVNIINTLADKHGVYVLYELILPTNKNISEVNINDYMKNIVHGLHIKSKNLLNNNGAVSMGISNFDILEVQKNKITLCEYIGISSEISDECVLFLSVMNNKKETSSQSDDIFNINLSWNFKYKDIDKRITVNKNLDINGINNTTLNQIDISPISIWIIAEGDPISTSICPIIKFTDGTEIKYDSRDKNAHAMFSNYQTGDNTKGYSILGYVFEEIIDIKTIESVTIGNQIIKVNE